MALKTRNDDKQQGPKAKIRMNSNAVANSWVSWVRIFDIPEVSKHKDGFTLYKIVSFLYPESCPDAVTKLIVWKRYNDFKKLHKDVKVLHKSLSLSDSIPNLPKSVLFKRYDEETINQRKRGILSFLEYVGTHSVLFTSPVFVKFFETSHTPADLLNSNISAIRAELNLPEETDLYNNSDDDRTISDTDSFTSSNLGSTAQAIDLLSDSISRASNLRKLNSMTSIDSQSSFSISNVDNSLVLLDGQISPTPSVTAQEATHYLVNASIHVNMAIELENDRQYEEAFSAYKTAVDILLSGGKDDPDYDRRQMVRYKTEKYLIRAERIYNMHLAPEIRDLHLQKHEGESGKPNNVKGPLYNLYKYKVIKVISPSGMLALHSEKQEVYYVKVIHKTAQALGERLILPERVPHMVQLVSHYNSENALFLILDYCRRAKLRDFLRDKQSLNKDEHLLRKIQDDDNESEQSFSELLNDYASNRHPKNAESDDESFEKVEISDVATLMAREVASSKPRTSSEASSFESSDEFDFKAHVEEQQVVRWASQLLVALEKLHELGVVCKDLTMEDLMVDEHEDLVITYMCSLKELGELYSKKVNLELAPEVYSFEGVTEAADWWSFGAILYELLVGVPLSTVHTNYAQLIIPKYVSLEGKSLLKQLLIYEPQERLGAKSSGVEHLKSHPFFRRVNWSSVQGPS